MCVCVGVREKECVCVCKRECVCEYVSSSALSGLRLSVIWV